MNQVNKHVAIDLKHQQIYISKTKNTMLNIKLPSHLHFLCGEGLHPAYSS
jgi:hypothetical protein